MLLLEDTSRGKKPDMKHQEQVLGWTQPILLSQIILNSSTQKVSQYLMLKLHQCSDDKVVAGELPCPFPCVPGQTDEPGRRGADLKSYSLTISCYVLSFA